MNPHEARNVAEFLITDFENEMQTTQRVLVAVPADRLDYQPDAKAKTGLGLVRHITLEDEWMLNCVANGEFTPPPDDSDECAIMSPTDAVARYKEKVPAALDRVRGMSGEQLTKVLDLMGLMQASAVNWLAMAVKHSVHHSVDSSARICVRWAAIYGPSADTQ